MTFARTLRTVAAVMAMSAALLAGRSSSAKDYFLTIGGGYSPKGNQISLEKNVLMFRELLGELYPAGAPHDVFFADGNDNAPDVQFRQDADSLPRVNVLLARIFRADRYLGYRYRTHQVPGIRGGTSRENIQKWFRTTGSKLAAGDRLFVYVTAHGGKADKKDPENTSLYVWNNTKLLMKELAAEFDRLASDVPVTVVMVQCYSGGFANLIFRGGDYKKGEIAPNRCAFLATAHSRPAAGCTPDINEANYREYSTYFWQALRGKTRTGEPVEPPDYNRDGAVSLAEAHAYALLTSDTIDISVKSSDAFLRKHSRLTDKQHKDLLTADSPLAVLLKHATAAERAVLEGLSEQLGLKQQKRAAEAEALASRILKEKKSTEAQYRKKVGEYGKVCKQLSTAVLNRWPELASPWDPAAAETVAGHGKEIVGLIEKHKEFKNFEKLRGEMKKLSAQKLDHDRRWAKTQRLIRTLENVALAHNLAIVADEKSQRQFEQLRAIESARLGE